MTSRVEVAGAAPDGFSKVEFQGGVELYLLKTLDAGVTASARRVDVGSHHEVRCSIKPARESQSNAGGQLKDCLSQLQRILEARGLSKDNVVQQTLLINSDGFGDNAPMLRQQLEDFYPDSVPSTGFIGQTPADGKQVAMEAVIAAPKPGCKLKIRREVVEEESGSADYSVVESEGVKWIHAAGLKGSTIGGDTAVTADGAFTLMKAILEREGLSFRDVILQKNYVHDICGPNYNKFNVVRSEVYGREGLVCNYPAATGIGMQTDVAGDVALEFTAVEAGRGDAEFESVENPKQQSSFMYDLSWLGRQAVGRPIGQQMGGREGAGQSVATPKFARGKYVRVGDGELFLVSGTAAIVGKEIQYRGELKEPAWVDVDDIVESVGGGWLRDRGLGVVAFPDGRMRVKAETAVEAQTWVTLKNITNLLAQKGFTLDDMAQARVYVKNLEDAGRVMGICEKIFRHKPALCVQGPVCYQEMLMEIEGVAAKTKK